MIMMADVVDDYEEEKMIMRCNMRWENLEGKE